MEVVFFDVGQGDAIFIKTAQGHQILIDGGPDSAVLEKLAENMPFWDRDIDIVKSVFDETNKEVKAEETKEVKSEVPAETEEGRSEEKEVKKKKKGK